MRALVLMLLAVSAVRGEICDFCVKDKAQSEVTLGLCNRTSIGWRAYYDAKGVFHSNDPNYSICDYECSRGHQYTRKLGPGNRVGPAELINLNVEIQSLVSTTAPMVVVRPKAVPTRILVCAINSVRFLALKEQFINCQRGNCASTTTMDNTATLQKLFESIECK